MNARLGKLAFGHSSKNRSAHREDFLVKDKAGIMERHRSGVTEPPICTRNFTEYVGEVL